MREGKSYVCHCQQKEDGAKMAEENSEPSLFCYLYSPSPHLIIIVCKGKLLDGSINFKILFRIKYPLLLLSLLLIILQSTMCKPR